ncbi:MAG TPA: methyltransferase domain-containing protein [Acidimicrobiales bacterium]|nr:methyltransferase domain-containing protein [Acidimicrobiales bacterium]
MSTGDVHHAATAFSGAAAVYEQARPGYPADALAWLGERLHLGPGRRVLDLAAGTGKLTRGLVAHGGSVVAGVAQAIPLGTQTVDAVTVAAALHWFATRRAVDEMYRVLRPGSSLAVVWNLRDVSDPLQVTIQGLMEPWRGDTPSRASGAWREVLEDARHGPCRFVPEAHFQSPWSQPTDVDGVVGRVASVSFVAAMDDATRQGLLAQVRAAAEQQPAPLALPYVTDIHCYRRAD